MALPVRWVGWINLPAQAFTSLDLWVWGVAIALIAATWLAYIFRPTMNSYGDWLMTRKSPGANIARMVVGVAVCCWVGDLVLMLARIMLAP